MFSTIRTGLQLAVILTGVAAAGSGAPSADAGQASSDYDAHFIEMTIQHHRDGIELANLEVTNGQSEKVKAIAQKIRQNQQKEIGELESLRPPSAHADESGTGSIAGMTMSQMERKSDSDKQMLQSAKGKEADRHFLHVMIEHHESAIRMGNDALQNAENPQLKEFTKRMVSGQRKEVDEMRTIASELD